MSSGPLTPSLAVRGHELPLLGGDGAVEIGRQIAGGKAGVVFHLGRQRQLSQRQSAGQAVFLGDGPFENQRLECGSGGVDGGRPGGGSAADDDDFFRHWLKLLVPTLRVERTAATLCDRSCNVVHRNVAKGRGASARAFPRRAWERGCRHPLRSRGRGTDCRHYRAFVRVVHGRARLLDSPRSNMMGESAGVTR